MSNFTAFKWKERLVRIVNLRAVGLGRVPKPHLPEGVLDKSSDASHAVIDEHGVYWQGKRVPTKIYDRSKLKPTNQVSGPAIITEFDSTTVVLSGYRAQVDRQFNLLITPEEH